jgi:serine phosphatase RsbU (regulator of sigma subunit)
MEVQIAVEKINKYATSESGDTVEIIERPQGGISVVLADGQSSGKGAKRISNMVTRKIVSLLAEGVRDGAAARAASDFLHTERKGKVSSTLNILSVDLSTNTLVITRNNPSPTLVFHHNTLDIYDAPSQPVGLYRNTRPLIVEIPLEYHLSTCIYTDGLVHAGTRYGTPFDAPAIFHALCETSHITPQVIADRLLKMAVEADRGRPADDISVVVLMVREMTHEDHVRRMLVRLPL